MNESQLIKFLEGGGYGYDKAHHQREQLEKVLCYAFMPHREHLQHKATYLQRPTPIYTHKEHSQTTNYYSLLKQLQYMRGNIHPFIPNQTMEHILHQQQQTKGNINHIQSRSIIMEDGLLYCYGNTLNKLNNFHEKQLILQVPTSILEIIQFLQSFIVRCRHHLFILNGQSFSIQEELFCEQEITCITTYNATILYTTHHQNHNKTYSFPSTLLREEQCYWPTLSTTFLNRRQYLSVNGVGWSVVDMNGDRVQRYKIKDVGDDRLYGGIGLWTSERSNYHFLLMKRFQMEVFDVRKMKPIHSYEHMHEQSPPYIMNYQHGLLSCYSPYRLGSCMYMEFRECSPSTIYSPHKQTFKLLFDSGKVNASMHPIALSFKVEGEETTFYQVDSCEGVSVETLHKNNTSLGEFDPSFQWFEEKLLGEYVREWRRQLPQKIGDSSDDEQQGKSKKLNYLSLKSFYQKIHENKPIQVKFPQPPLKEREYRGSILHDQLLTPQLLAELQDNWSL